MLSPCTRPTTHHGHRSRAKFVCSGRTRATPLALTRRFGSGRCHISTIASCETNPTRFNEVSSTCRIMFRSLRPSTTLESEPFLQCLSARYTRIDALSRPRPVLLTRLYHLFRVVDTLFSAVTPRCVHKFPFTVHLCFYRVVFTSLISTALTNLVCAITALHHRASCVPHCSRGRRVFISLTRRYV